MTDKIKFCKHVSPLFYGFLANVNKLPDFPYMKRKSNTHLCHFGFFSSWISIEVTYMITHFAVISFFGNVVKLVIKCGFNTKRRYTSSKETHIISV